LSSAPLDRYNVKKRWKLYLLLFRQTRDQDGKRRGAATVETKYD